MSSANKNDIKTTIRTMSIYSWYSFLFFNQCIFCDMRNTVDKSNSSNEKISMRKLLES